MRSLRSMFISGWVVLLLLATAGFAAYSTRGESDPGAQAAPEIAAVPAALPAVSGRVGAFILAEAITPPPTAAPVPDPIAPTLATDATTTSSSSTTTTTASTTTTEATASTTTTTAAPTTTEATTTTTAAAATTTTAAPATTTTTTAPATTTTSEATTTTLPATGTTEVSESTTTTTTAPRATGSGAEQWRGLVAAYFPAALVDQALVVIQCESRGDPSARNPYSGASGLFQFMPRTWSWASEGAGFAGADVYDAEANVASAAWLVDYSLATGHSGGAWGHWNCKP